MNSSANNSFDPTHSSDSGSDGTPDSSSVYAERYSARSPNDTLLADTQLLATPATSDELLSDAFQRYFSMSEVTDLTKHLLSLGPDAIAEIAAIFQVTVAPSTTTQSPTHATFFTACKNAEAIEASLFARGIARTDPSGGGVALVFLAALRPPSDPTRVTRTAFPPSAILGATRASVPPNVMKQKLKPWFLVSK